jgi:hypothetical protein
MVKDDNMILIRVNNEHEGHHLDRFLLMGECLVPRHAAHPTEPDNGVNSSQAFVTMDDVNYTSTFRGQFYLADGTWLAGGSLLYNSVLLGQDVCEGPPWAWMTPGLYVSHNDLDTYGIVAGDGIKGDFNSEWFRLLAVSGGPVNDKQRLNGGNFIYLRNGICVGWDPSNGGMA